MYNIKAYRRNIPLHDKTHARIYSQDIESKLRGGSGVLGGKYMDLLGIFQFSKLLRKEIEASYMHLQALLFFNILFLG